MSGPQKTGRVYGVGLGPGDPELMSVKADRLLRSAKHVAFFRKKGRAGRARAIVEGMLHADVVEFAMEYPVTTEIPLSDPRYNAVLSDFYAEVTAHLCKLSSGGEDVVVLCEGDPFFYGSFMHLYERLKDICAVEVVPAITGMSAAWTATGAPITWGDDVLSVVMGTLDEAALSDAMARADALVVMKIGRNLAKVRRALEAAGKLERAVLVQYAAMEGQSVCALSDYGGETLPYFSIIVVHGQGRRP
jgi:precorrin-2/cobalt-factor-2 C20-methyltransferase